MRRLATPLVVAGILLLGVLAAADALRGDREPDATASVAATTRPPTLRETLRSQGISGQILYSDQECILHSLVLPGMVDEVVRGENGAGAFHYCRFSIAAGRIAAESDLVSPDQTLIARCRRGWVDVLDAPSRRLLSRVRGCPAAWRPDGSLTHVRAGEIVQGNRVLLTRLDLHRAAFAHPNVAGLGASIPFKVFARDITWLDETHLLASLEVQIKNVGPQFLAVLLDDNAIVDVAASFRGPYAHLFASATGRFAAAEDGTVFARDGGSIDLPQNLPNGRAVGFSPDERWLAYVTGASVFLVATPHNGEPGRVIRLPIPAQDLVWEGVSRATRVAGLGTG